MVPKVSARRSHLMVALQTSVDTKLAELVLRGVSRWGAQCSLSAYTATDTIETACGGNCT